MKYYFLVLFGLFILCNQAIAATPIWSGDPWGGGIGVEAIYLKSNTNELVFKGDDGITYSYPWSSSSPEVQITDNAKAVLAVLNMAFLSDKKVNIYYYPDMQLGGGKYFLQIILVK